MTKLIAFLITGLIVLSACGETTDLTGMKPTEPTPIIKSTPTPTGTPIPIIIS